MVRIIKWKVISKLSCFMTFDEELVNFFQLIWEKWSNLYLKLKNGLSLRSILSFSGIFFGDFYDYVSILPHPPTPLVRKHKHLALPPHPPLWLRNIWMVPNRQWHYMQINFWPGTKESTRQYKVHTYLLINPELYF